jgi:hypothetical protein
MDNLQGITYQTFEQDPVKYQKYEEVRDDLMPQIERLPKSAQGNVCGSV